VGGGQSLDCSAPFAGGSVTSPRYSVIRDSVHGDVYLTHEELAILDTPEMQRLRGVKQLGTADLVFPGATHTRFDHSIGVLHMAQALIDAANRNFEQDPRGHLSVGAREARVVRAAALVHDVTHIPCGHHFEDQSGLFHRHDTAYRYRAMLGPGTELGRKLEELELASDVLHTLLEERAPRESGERVPAYWAQILSDTISADILDYLQRDAHYTGLRLSVDPRVVNYFRIDRASGNLYLSLSKRDLLREDVLSEVVRLLEARYYFSERVYYHHAKVAAGAMVSRAVELALSGGLVTEADFYGLTDASLLDLLERKAERARPELGRRIRSLVERFRRRRLVKRACVFPRYANEAAQEDLVARFFTPGRQAERWQVEERIADVVRFATGREIEIVLYCPAATMQLKEVHTHVRWPGESDVRPLAAYADRVPRLADLERAYRGLWKFYVFADTDDPALLAKVQEVALGELPHATNVYRVET
jgi:HD superfamily phosphohydrolase